jgi:transposase
MKLVEGWQMYSKIQELKRLNLNVSQIARCVGVSRNTIYKFINMTPEEFNRDMERRQTRRKKLDAYKNEIVGWLKEYPDLSASQIHDWLQEKHPGISVSERTVCNFVNQLRKEYVIPKIVHQRLHEAIPDPPMGYQVQVDFGEAKLNGYDGMMYKLWFVAFVLSHSRQKYVEWLDRPFTTSDLIRTHENCFQYYGGMPVEFVYDQDRLILVSENYGDLIYTYEFEAYRQQRNFKIRMCKKGDPESKGRIENVVGFVKKNFAKHRIYYNLNRLNEECLAWLERTSNGKKHNTTKKIPAEVFLEEKKHLRPVPTRITVKAVNDSISRFVRKDNTISFKGNRYSVPLGTYNGTGKQVQVSIEEKDILVITDSETGKEIARHPLHYGKGKLIKNRNHGRDRSKGIPEYLEKVTEMLGNTAEAKEFLNKIYELKPRYIRDQLQLICSKVKDVDSQTMIKAVNFCCKNKIYSAVDFVDALAYFNTTQKTLKAQELTTEKVAIKMLDGKDVVSLKIKPQVRDIKVYQQILSEEKQCHNQIRN